MKTVLAFIIGLALGAAGGAGYFYPQVQSALSKASVSETNLQSLKDEGTKLKSLLEKAIQEAKDKIAQYQGTKQTDDQTIKTLKEQLAAAVTAKEAAEAARQAAETAKLTAEKALAEAKKPAPQ